MEPRNLGFSLKNVPLAPKKQYLQSMTRLRFILNDYDGKHSFLRIQMPMKKDPNFECFKFSLTPPQNKHLTQIENHLYDMVRNIEFNTKSNFKIHQMNFKSNHQKCTGVFRQNKSL